MKKDIFISIRITDEDKESIRILRRYDEHFNASAFFRESLAARMEAIKKEMGIGELRLPIEMEKKQDSRTKV